MQISARFSRHNFEFFTSKMFKFFQSDLTCLLFWNFSLKKSYQNILETIQLKTGHLFILSWHNFNGLIKIHNFCSKFFEIIFVVFVRHFQGAADVRVTRCFYWLKSADLTPKSAKLSQKMPQDSILKIALLVIKLQVR